MITMITNHNRKICNEFYSLNEMGLFILNYYFKLLFYFQVWSQC